MPVVFTNNAEGSLASGISATQTTISLETGQGALFPSPGPGEWFPITIYLVGGAYEIMHCTSRTGDTFTVARGQEGTAGQAFAADALAELRLTAAALAEVKLEARNYTDTSFSSRTLTAGDGLAGGGTLGADRTFAVDASVVRTSRSLTAGNGLSGGGDLSANRTFTLGTPGTITAATTNSATATSHTHSLSINPADIGAAIAGRIISAGSGLSGGGDLTADRSLALGTPGTLTAATTNAVTAGSHTHSISLTAADVGASPTTRVMTAGSGLSGGGDLTADRTFALGTPGTLTAATLNAVTATSHTHQISLTAADVGAPPTTRILTAGDGLSGGGDLSANRSFAVDTSVVRTTRTVSSGNGLTGGGALSANQILTLGTPDTLSGATSNGVTISSHTHAISSTASRTDTSTATLLQAKAMNDHRLSGDHNSLYYMKTEVDDRRELVTAGTYGLVTRTKRYKTLWFQVPMTATQQIRSSPVKVAFTTDTALSGNDTTAWYFPSQWWSTTNHRFTAPVEGLYMFYAQIFRAPGASSTTAVNIHFRKNGINISGPQGFGPGPGDFVSGDNTYFPGRIEMMIYLFAGDYIEVWNSGQPVDLLGSLNEKATYFGGWLL